jgi:hypothetical protein
LDWQLLIRAPTRWLTLQPAELTLGSIHFEQLKVNSNIALLTGPIPTAIGQLQSVTNQLKQPKFVTRFTT